MKKSLLALAVLTAFAGAAAAQSSVTVAGKVDVSLGKAIGTKDKAVMDNAQSRIAFRGYEDLGNGMGAIFAFEHWFYGDTGQVRDAGTFWNGFALIGLRAGAFGTVTLGRQYTSAFLNVQNQVDPFEGETIAGTRNIAADIGGIGASTGRLARADNSVKYANTFGPVTVSADIAEAAANGSDRPYSVAVSGVFGPVWVGVAYDDPSASRDEAINVAGRVTFGPATFSAMVTSGTRQGATTPATDTDVLALLLGAKIKVGTGDIKLAYVQRETETATGVTTKVNQRFALGYDHNLSKRTKIYATFARDNKATTPAGSIEKNGYDVGLQHKF